MPPRQAPAVPATEDDHVERMANSMNLMAAIPPKFRGDGGPAAAEKVLDQ
ncbi:hypothetical protein A2U01_0049907, partial [Trifolium medium]|nr:hypothetical protein [Trifolium medium]